LRRLVHLQVWLLMIFLKKYNKIVKIFLKFFFLRLNKSIDIRSICDQSLSDAFFKINPKIIKLILNNNKITLF